MLVASSQTNDGVFSPSCVWATVALMPETVGLELLAEGGEEGGGEPEHAESAAARLSPAAGKLERTNLNIE
jgi:hypothetical protein